jgi:hypothetical protein
MPPTQPIALTEGYEQEVLYDIALGTMNTFELDVH